MGSISNSEYKFVKSKLSCKIETSIEIKLETDEMILLIEAYWND